MTWFCPIVRCSRFWALLSHSSLDSTSLILPLTPQFKIDWEHKDEGGVTARDLVENSQHYIHIKMLFDVAYWRDRLAEEKQEQLEKGEPSLAWRAKRACRLIRHDLTTQQWLWALVPLVGRFFGNVFVFVFV